MKYYKYINSKGIECGYGVETMDADEYGSTDVQNIEVSYEEYQMHILRKSKLDEALAKAYDFEQNGTVEYKNCVFEMSLSNRHNLDNTQEALEKSGETETPWNDKNDELVTLTLEDVQYIRLNLILGRIKKLWITDYPRYKNQILNAKTVKELKAIEIDYNRKEV